MALSGSKNFTQTRTELILNALSRLELYGIGRTVSSEDMALCATELNYMIKFWATKGLLLHTKEEGILYLTPNTAKYTIGDDASYSHTTLTDEASETFLSAAGAASDTSLTLDDTTGMTADDNIGIVLDDKTIQWTTIATVASSTSVTLDAALTGAASENNLVFSYTSRIYKPLRLLDARSVTGIGDNKSELMLAPLPYQTYMELPIKSSSSFPTQFTYKPNNTNGTIYLWPCPSTAANRIAFTFERIMDDLDEASNNFDFPTEWLEPASWQLSARLAPHFGKEAKLQTILPIASVMMDDLLAWNREISELTIEPDLGYH